jgi:hypothetical protein
MNRKTFLFFILLLVCAISCLNQDSRVKVTTSPPRWRGLTPGKTTKQELVRILGEPAERYTDVLGRSRYTYASKAGLGDPHYIYLENEVVKLISSYEDSDRPEWTHLSKFFNQCGQPEKVTWTWHGAQERSFIFASKGLVVVANNTAVPDHANVYRVDYFEPMPLERFMSKHGEYFLNENPFPGLDKWPEDYYVDPEHPYYFH